MVDIGKTRTLLCAMLVMLALGALAVAALAQGDAPPAAPPEPGQGDDVFAGAGPGDDVNPGLEILFNPGQIPLDGGQPVVLGDVPPGSLRVTSTVVPDGSAGCLIDTLAAVEGAQREDTADGPILFTLPLEMTETTIRARVQGIVLGLTPDVTCWSVGAIGELPSAGNATANGPAGWSETRSDVTQLGQQCAQEVAWPRADIRCYLEPVGEDTYKRHDLGGPLGYQVTADLVAGDNGQARVKLTLTRRVPVHDTFDPELGAYVGDPQLEVTTVTAEIALPQDKVLAIVWPGPRPLMLTDLGEVGTAAEVDAPIVDHPGPVLLITLEPPGSGTMLPGGAYLDGNAVIRLTPNLDFYRHLDVIQPAMPGGGVLPDAPPEKP